MLMSNILLPILCNAKYIFNCTENICHSAFNAESSLMNLWIPDQVRNDNVFANSSITECIIWV
jgi:hypothetical protein